MLQKADRLICKIIIYCSLLSNCKAQWFYFSSIWIIPPKLILIIYKIVFSFYKFMIIGRINTFKKSLIIPLEQLRQHELTTFLFMT